MTDYEMMRCAFEAVVARVRAGDQGVIDAYREAVRVHDLDVIDLCLDLSHEPVE